jgi:diheme cytochrome c
MCRRLTIVTLLGGMVLLASCQSARLPGEGSDAAQLYINRCGQCHPAYNPSQMTAAMWATQVDLMQERMKQTGLAPLTPAERKTILDYLTSNAGRQ